MVLKETIHITSYMVYKYIIDLNIYIYHTDFFHTELISIDVYVYCIRLTLWTSFIFYLSSLILKNEYSFPFPFFKYIFRILCSIGLNRFQTDYNWNYLKYIYLNFFIGIYFLHLLISGRSSMFVKASNQIWIMQI